MGYCVAGRQVQGGVEEEGGGRRTALEILCHLSDYGWGWGDYWVGYAGNGLDFRISGGAQESGSKASSSTATPVTEPSPADSQSNSKQIPSPKFPKPHSLHQEATNADIYADSYPSHWKVEIRVEVKIRGEETIGSRSP